MMTYRTLMVLLLFITAPLFGKTAEAFDWKQLVGCLPDIAEIDGFAREAAEGDNAPDAWAMVNYSREGKGDISEDETDYGSAISVMISDCNGAADYIEAMLEISEFDTPASIMGRYRGKKTLEQNESGIYGCGYTFVVNDRFLVELKSSGKADVFAQMDKLIAAMKLHLVESIE